MMLSRCKPFKYTYEKEIVMYAYFKKLDYFSTECIYSPNAYRLDFLFEIWIVIDPLLLRGYARAYIKDVEKIRATAIIDIIHSGEQVFACQMNCLWKSFLHETRTSRDMGTLRLFKIVVSLASSCIDTVAVILHLG